MLRANSKAMTSRLRSLPDPSRVASALRKQLPRIPSVALVLGSGFQSATSELQDCLTIPYGRVPGFPAVSVPGHQGALHCGLLGGVPVLVLAGRAHFYEGHPMDRVTFPVKVLAALGVEALLLTNAAGGINARFRVGDYMQIEDHINAMGTSPLRGQSREGKPVFLDCTRIYDASLGRMLGLAAREAKCKLHSGVYIAVSGPTYETPAEIRAFRCWGADAVGMSTVPEALVAHSYGIRVAGLSCITNAAAGVSGKTISHQEVLEAGRRAAQKAARFLTGFVQRYASESTQTGRKGRFA